MSNNSELNPARRSNLPQGRWSHLNKYELKYLKEAIKAYDEIVRATDDVPEMSCRYELDPNDVRRAKDYAFGSGVPQYEFSPDTRMAGAWKRMASGQGTDLDEILLRHEVFESDLINWRNKDILGLS